MDIDYDDLVSGKSKVNVFKQEGDFVLIKSDGYPTYHYANVVDDHLMSITHVLRGQEWQSSIGKHLLLYKAFNWQPPSYVHLPLIYHSDGTKLSKRHGNIDVLSYRERGILPEALLSYLTTVNGGFRDDQNQNRHLEQFRFVDYKLDELVNSFELKALSTRPVKYDEQVILKINKQYLAGKPTEDLIANLSRLLRKKYENINPHFLSTTFLSQILKCTIGRINTLNELAEDSYAYLWTDFKFTTFEKYFKDNQKPFMLEFVNFLINYIDNHFVDTASDSEIAALKSQMDTEFKTLKTKTDFNLWNLFRLLLTGSKQGPPVFDILFALGKDNSLFRLRSAKKCFESD